MDSAIILVNCSVIDHIICVNQILCLWCLVIQKYVILMKTTEKYYWLHH